MCRLRRRRLPGPAPAGGPGFAALRPAGLFPHPFGALQMCRLRRRRLPGPAPAAVLDLPRCARRGFFRAPSGRSRCAACGGGDCRDPPRRAGLDLPRCARRGFFRTPSGRSRCAACGGGDCRDPPRRRSWICRAAPDGAFFAPLQDAPDVPPAAAEIAGTRPGRRADFLHAQEVGGRRTLKGTSALGGLPGLRPERATRDGRSRALRPATPA